MSKTIYGASPAVCVYTPRCGRRFLVGREDYGVIDSRYCYVYV